MQTVLQEHRFQEALNLAGRWEGGWAHSGDIREDLGLTLDYRNGKGSVLPVFTTDTFQKHTSDCVRALNPLWGGESKFQLPSMATKHSATELQKIISYQYLRFPRY